METIGAIIVMAMGASLAAGGADVLRNLRLHCDEALHTSTLTEPSRHIKAWTWTLYTTAGVGALTAGTATFGLALVDLVF